MGDIVQLASKSIYTHKALGSQAEELCSLKKATNSSAKSNYVALFVSVCFVLWVDEKISSSPGRTCTEHIERDRSLNIKIYRKLTHTDQHLLFDSNHPT